MIEQKTGLVSTQMIKDKILEDHGIKLKDIHEHTSYREHDVSFSFDKKNNDKYNTTTTITLEKKELLSIVKKILLADGIQSDNIQIEFEHIPGDSFEPMDYGTYKFIGFKFTL